MVRLGIAQTDKGGVLAVARDGAAMDLAAAARAAGDEQIGRLDSLDALLAVGPDALRRAGRLGADPAAWKRHAIENPRWRAPLTRPQKLCCIGLNYSDHAREQGLEPPKAPLLFAKYPSAIIGPDEEITWDPGLSDQVDWEAELAVVIGQTARRVPPERAFDYVAGYMPSNDVTARNLQKGDGQFTRGKSLDTFCPIGPQLVTRDEVPRPHELPIRLRVNGVLKQDSNTSNLIFKVPDLIAYLSRAFTLRPGDIVMTGTPSGVGMHRKPPEFLHDGDTVEVEIEGLGKLRNRCRTYKA